MFMWMWNMEVKDAQHGDKTVDGKGKKVENVDKGNVERRESRRRKWNLISQNLNQKVRRHPRNPLQWPLTMPTNQRLMVPPPAEEATQRLYKRTWKPGPCWRIVTGLPQRPLIQSSLLRPS
jgi:hypothetical protein